MPRNAQWTAQEDQELTSLTLTKCKEKNGNLDWDEIHDLRSGMICRRSKNAMISRWWKIKEVHNFDSDNEENKIETHSMNENETEMNNDDILGQGKRSLSRGKKKKKEDVMQNVIHSILRKDDDDESESEDDMISYKNYYRHDIETLKLTSFDLTQLKPYIRAFEEQILMGNVNGNDVGKENNNLRKTIMIQNKFLSELYTKIQHQQGIVREMVEVSEKLKFQTAYIDDRNKDMQHMFHKEIVVKEEECDRLRRNEMILQHKLDTKSVIHGMNGISHNNDLNQMIDLMHNLSQILSIQNVTSEAVNVSQMIATLKCKLYDILDKTEYGENMQNMNRNKRKRDEIMQIGANGINPRKKRKKTHMHNDQLSLPTIGNNANTTNNGNRHRVQPVLFTPSMTAEYQRILPPSLSAHVPPPLPPQNTNKHKPPPLPPPPPPTSLNNCNTVNKYGIDLLLKVAMLDHQNN